MKNSTHFKSLLSAFMVAGVLGSAQAAFALDEVTYGTNWVPEAEHGGFYQAVVDGTYEKYGLKVTIVPGGPQAANDALLVSGKIDFYMGGSLKGYDYVKQDIPMVHVASIFQKDPQVLLAHPDKGIEKFADLAKLGTIFMGKDGYVTYFEWMKGLGVGFKDEQFKPYTFNPGPFLADDNSAQQGYLTSEPYAIEKEAGWSPKVFLLADEGWSPYSTMITTSQKLVDENPDLVQRFVDASIEGWYNYLYGDNTAANEMIKKENPEMTDGQIEYSIAKMKEYGIVDSGDTLEKGIGCMTDERNAAFFEELTKIGVFETSLDYKKSYTTQFVCKGVGMDLKK